MNGQLESENFDAVNPRKPKREAFQSDDLRVDAKDHEDSESKYDIRRKIMIQEHKSRVSKQKKKKVPRQRRKKYPCNCARYMRELRQRRADIQRSTRSEDDVATQKPIMNRLHDDDKFEAANPKEPKRRAFPSDDDEVDGK